MNETLKPVKDQKTSLIHENISCLNAVKGFYDNSLS
jgi:hypothetical protein